MKIEITIDDAKISKVEEAFKELFPIPVITTGVEPDDDKVPKFTEQEWVKEVLRQFIVQNEARYRQSKARKDISLDTDDTLAT